MLRRLSRLLPADFRSKKYLKFIYFRMMAALGIEQLPAVNGIAQKMLAYLPPKGVFVEAGGNDGISQSNTWFLEAYRGWTGLLIEPVPELAKMARRFRRAPVSIAALGSADGGSLTLRLADLMTQVDDGKNEGQHITAPVRSLSSLLDEYGLSSVDFLSLDEPLFSPYPRDGQGYEIPVLQGLDLTRHAPRFILVETGQLAAVQARLGQDYAYRTALSPGDHLFERVAG